MAKPPLAEWKCKHAGEREQESNDDESCPTSECPGRYRITPDPPRSDTREDKYSPEQIARDCPKRGIHK